MGMLLHNTLMAQDAEKRNAKVEKPVEVPKETNEPEAEPAKKPVGRRKTSK